MKIPNTEHPSGQALLSPEPPQRGLLTPEQIKNWRTALIGVLGPYALIMPDADIQRYRDRMQEHADLNA